MYEHFIAGIGLALEEGQVAVERLVCKISCRYRMVTVLDSEGEIVEQVELYANGRVLPLGFYFRLYFASLLLSSSSIYNFREI